MADPLTLGLVALGGAVAGYAGSRAMSRPPPQQAAPTPPPEVQAAAPPEQQPVPPPQTSPQRKPGGGQISPNTFLGAAATPQVGAFGQKTLLGQ